MHKVTAVFILNFCDLKKIVDDVNVSKIMSAYSTFFLFLQKTRVVFGVENLKYTLTFVQKWCFVCIFQICEGPHNIISNKDVIKTYNLYFFYQKKLKNMKLENNFALKLLLLFKMIYCCLNGTLTLFG